MLCSATSDSGDCGCRAALVSLKDGIRDADLVRLGPHELMEHRSSAVLLKGTLHTSGRASYVPPAANSRTSLHRASMDRGNGNGTGMALLPIKDVPMPTTSICCCAHGTPLWATLMLLSTPGHLAFKRSVGSPSRAFHVQGPSAAAMRMQQPAHRRSTRRPPAPLEMWRTLVRGRNRRARG